MIEFKSLQERISEQRKEHLLSYQSTDFPAEIYALKLASGEIIIPEYQRRFLWSEQKQSEFIESLMINLPSPSLFFIENKDGILEVADGSQRIRTLENFFSGKLVLSGLKLLTELNNCTINDLDIALQRKFKNTNIKGYVFPELTDKITQDIFRRINTQSSALTDI